jgi:hypothetical protein
MRQKHTPDALDAALVDMSVDAPDAAGLVVHIHSRTHLHTPWRPATAPQTPRTTPGARQRHAPFCALRTAPTRTHPPLPGAPPHIPTHTARPHTRTAPDTRRTRPARTRQPSARPSAPHAPRRAPCRPRARPPTRRMRRRAPTHATTPRATHAAPTDTSAPRRAPPQPPAPYPQRTPHTHALHPHRHTPPNTPSHTHTSLQRAHVGVWVSGPRGVSSDRVLAPCCPCMRGAVWMGRWRSSIDAGGAALTFFLICWSDFGLRRARRARRSI